jgi:hypothetical protein
MLGIVPPPIRVFGTCAVRLYTPFPRKSIVFSNFFLFSHFVFPQVGVNQKNSGKFPCQVLFFASLPLPFRFFGKIKKRKMLEFVEFIYVNQIAYGIFIGFPKAFCGKPCGKCGKVHCFHSKNPEQPLHSLWKRLYSPDA